jgi:hypothetical protein
MESMHNHLVSLVAQAVPEGIKYGWRILTKNLLAVDDTMSNSMNEETSEDSLGM